MGTRSSTGFIHQNKYTGVYNQFDGYLEGVGKEVVETLRTLLKPDDYAEDEQKSIQEKIELLKQRMTVLKPVTDKIPPTPEEQNIYKRAGFCNLQVSRQSPDDWYCLLRELQGSRWIIEAYNGNLFHILDGSDFPKDSIWCEYAYAINFDTNMLEIYKGFQKTPQEGNVFGIEPADRPNAKEGDNYYPCAKVIEFPLGHIPNDWMKQTQKACGYGDDDE